MKIKKVKSFAYELARESPTTRLPGLLGRPRKAQETVTMILLEFDQDFDRILAKF